MFGLHYRLETRAIGLVLAIIGVSSIGGLVEIAPLFTIHQTVEEAPGMRLYTPLEIAGRNIYMREGCYACHSQMIRTLREMKLSATVRTRLRSSRSTTIRCCGVPSAPGLISQGSAESIPTSGTYVT